MPIPQMTNAQNSKNDEFYTQYEDIEKEIMSYLDFDSNLFEGKTVLLPCDDPEWSNFTKFFAQNFESFKLKKLTHNVRRYAQCGIQSANLSSYCKLS